MYVCTAAEKQLLKKRYQRSTMLIAGRGLLLLQLLLMFCMECSFVTSVTAKRFAWLAVDLYYRASCCA